MWILGTLVSLFLIGTVLLDGFEAMVLPRRVTHAYRLVRFYYRTAWKFWRALARCLPPGRKREALLSVFGPLSILMLFATWVVGLIVGYALLLWSLGIALQTPSGPPQFTTYFYMSGVTFFTLGYGDVTPAAPLGRFLVVVEAGMGFGFIAIIIGYLPVLYQAFSHREGTIVLLDARAGSPPSVAEFLRRLSLARDFGRVNSLLEEWERWAAEVLESHLSFPVLSYYRSQHDNQSWLAALTMMLDTCAFVIAALKDGPRYQAQLTFAMARHVAVDLALVFKVPPVVAEVDRLPTERLHQLCASLRQAGLTVVDGTVVAEKLAELRAMYEPFITGLASFLMFTIPPMVPEKTVVDNWQTSAWMRRTPGIGGLPMPAEVIDEHFD